jgi:hypothetical protein
MNYIKNYIEYNKTYEVNISKYKHDVMNGSLPTQYNKLNSIDILSDMLPNDFVLNEETIEYITLDISYCNDYRDKYGHEPLGNSLIMVNDDPLYYYRNILIEILTKFR